MSKIAEKRTDEIVGEYHDGDYTDHSRHNTRWCGFREGYDQAMQDFLEKAEKFFNEGLYVSVSDQICSVDEFSAMSNFIEQFKNYVQNESEKQ